MSESLPSSTRSQRGQALVMTLLFGAVAGLAVLLLFNNSLLANSKSQLQNAADAAAYSAGVLQARDHNFSAYTNRAMIANQVAVAQFVSLESYFEDAAATSSRANSVLQNTVYRLLPSFAPAWDLAVQIPMSSIQSGVSAISRPAIVALNLLIDGLEFAQQAHHIGTAADMMLVADEVVKSHYPNLSGNRQPGITQSAFMLANGAAKVLAWANDATERHSANDASAAADRFADAVVDRDSTDWFIRNRASVPTAAWASLVKPYLCPGASFTQTIYGFSHFGGTLLSSNKKRWLALDATMGGGEWTCTWQVGPFPVTIGSPLPDIGTSAPFLGGHGGAQAGNGSGYSSEFRGYARNPFESWLYGGALISPAIVPAQYRFWAVGPDATLDSNGGLQDHYRDMRNPTTATRPNDQTPQNNGGRFPLTIEVQHPNAGINTSAKLLPASTRLRLDDNGKGNTMRTIASAHAFFYRPRNDDASQFSRNGWRRGDGKTEYQSLFSPYWQARLAPSSVLEEAGSLAAQ
jgi:Putative Flp pilus-assembly TadE/G-like